MDDKNWLEAKVISCPMCGLRLFAVVHSPFHDNERLYCDHCPRAVDVSFYDPEYQGAVKELASSHTWEQYMAAIEPLLRPCSCGGRFRGEAARRCFSCSAVVPSAAQMDLFLYTGCEDSGRDPSPDEWAAFNAFEAQFIESNRPWATGTES